VTAQKVDDWATRSDRAASALSGIGYIYVFADFNATPRRTRDVSRNRYLVRKTFECQISDNVVAFRRDRGKWKMASLPCFYPLHDDMLLSRVGR
jgi:hypothetical protein